MTQKSPIAEALVELARQVRSDTLTILEATPENWLRYAAPGTNNHILWHAGHALWLQDVLCLQLFDDSSQLPDGWAARFGMDSNPATADDDWPTAQFLRNALAAQLQQVVERLSLTPDDWFTQRHRYRSRAGQIVHGWHDEAKHSGEMYLLWKMCRAQQVAKTGPD